jgi:hypothetical protein
MKAYKHLIKHALAQGHIVSVYDGECWDVRSSSAYKAIIDSIESVEIAEIVIKDKYTGNRMGWAQIVPFGVEDDETVADNTMTPFMNDWEAAYQKTQTV